MNDKQYIPSEALHLQQAHKREKYNPRTAGEFWNIKRKIQIGDSKTSKLRTRYKSDNKTPLFLSRRKIDLFL